MSEPSSPDGEPPRYVAFELRVRGRGTAYLVWDRQTRAVVRQASTLAEAWAQARWLNTTPPAPRRRTRRAGRRSGRSA